MCLRLWVVHFATGLSLNYAPLAWQTSGRRKRVSSYNNIMIGRACTSIFFARWRAFVSFLCLRMESSCRLKSSWYGRAPSFVYSSPYAFRLVWRIISSIFAQPPFVFFSRRSFCLGEIAVRRCFVRVLCLEDFLVIVMHGVYFLSWLSFGGSAFIDGCVLLEVNCVLDVVPSCMCSFVNGKERKTHLNLLWMCGRVRDTTRRPRCAWKRGQEERGSVHPAKWQMERRKERMAPFRIVGNDVVSEICHLRLCSVLGWK